MINFCPPGASDRRSHHLASEQARLAGATYVDILASIYVE
jgi:hypothetical protein